jgi:hypothetical protein
VIVMVLGGRMVIEALPEAIWLLEFVAVAVTVTVGEAGTFDGAVYTPVEFTVPTEEFPPAIPFTLQVTVAVLAPAPLTEAVSWI